MDINLEENIIIENNELYQEEFENLSLDTDDEQENIIEKECLEIKELYNKAKYKSDYDAILDKYKIKIKKNDKLLSCKYEKLNIKKLVISMRFNEPHDCFDFDYYREKQK